MAMFLNIGIREIRRTQIKQVYCALLCSFIEATCFNPLKGSSSYRGWSIYKIIRCTPTWRDPVRYRLQSQLWKDGNTQNYRIVNFPDWVWTLFITPKFVGWSTVVTKVIGVYILDGCCVVSRIIIIIIIIIDVVVVYSLCKRRTVAHVVYWSMKTSRRGALFCI
jgi:hypothetical protein